MYKPPKIVTQQTRIQFLLFHFLVSVCFSKEPDFPNMGGARMPHYRSLETGMRPGKRIKTEGKGDGKSREGREGR